MGWKFWKAKEQEPAPELTEDPWALSHYNVIDVPDLLAEADPPLFDEVEAFYEDTEPTFGSQYEGRLVCDGNGQLCADEGEWKGFPVAYAGGGTYVFVGPGERTHNQRFHRQFVNVVQASETDPHFYEAQPGDAHYDETAPGKTTLKWDDDVVAEKITGHTEAYKNDQ